MRLDCDVSELLLDHGANINATLSYNNWTPLMEACWTGHSSVTKFLLDRGCNINAISECGGYTAHFT